MKKIIKSFMLLGLLSSCSYANNNTEEKSLLSIVKEKAGVELSDEQKYALKIKENLLQALEYQVQEKRIRKVDDNYLTTKNKIINIKNIEDIFNKDFMFSELILETPLNEKETIPLYDFIFGISFSDKNKNSLNMFLSKLNVNPNSKVSFNFEYLKKDLTDYEIKERLNLILEKLYDKKELKEAYFNNTSDYNKRNDLFNFSNIDKYDYYYNYYRLVSYQDNYNVNPIDYIRFLKSEQKIKGQSLHTYFKENLEKDIKKNKKLNIKETIYITKSPILADNNLKYYYAISYDLEIDFVKYLLKATNEKDIMFDKPKFIFDKADISEDIRLIYSNLYNIDITSITIKNLKENLLIYTDSGEYYKTISKQDFLKRKK